MVRGHLAGHRLPSFLGGDDGAHGAFGADVCDVQTTAGCARQLDVAVRHQIFGQTIVGSGEIHVFAVAHDRQAQPCGGCHRLQHDAGVHDVMSVIADDAHGMTQGLEVVDCHAVHVLRDGGALVHVDEADRGCAVQHVLHLKSAADDRLRVRHEVDGRIPTTHGCMASACQVFLLRLPGVPEVGVQVAKSGQACKPARFDSSGAVRGESLADGGDDTAPDKDVHCPVLDGVDYVCPVYEE